tara:strand:- start:1221 stop:1832 length:612 start_codon:yes stop_codon:yes gene_type:complete
VVFITLLENIKSMNKLVLIGVLILYSQTSFSQTTHSISVDCFGAATSLTIPLGDKLQFVNDGCNGAQQFQVDIDGNSIDGSPFYTLVGDTIYETLQLTTDFTIGVYALDDMSQWRVIEVTIYNPVDIDDLTDVHFSVYPNPTIDYLNISSQNIESVKVYNMIGRLVLSDTNTTSDLKLDVSSLKNGVYLTVVNGKKRFKFIKK